MKIDVSELLKAVGNELKIESEEKVAYPEDNLVLEKPVKVRLKLLNTGETILVTGEIKGEIKLTCCRCLKDFNSPFLVEVEEEYTTRPVRLLRGRQVELKPEDFYFQIGDDKTVDFSEAVRQNILTSLPIKPLCDKACRGIDFSTSAG